MGLLVIPHSAPCCQYPFTTIVPNLGVWLPPDRKSNVESSDSVDTTGGLVLCDIPGLIAGTWLLRKRW
jgi:GTPase involved in cell partitioning and DNA repair